MFQPVMNRDELNKTIRELENTSNTIGFNYIPTGLSQRNFFAEINGLISLIRREIGIQCMSLVGGVKTLQEEIEFLRNQQFQLMTGRMVQYAAVKKEVHNRRINLILKQVGFVGGGAQVFGGFGICAASLGTLCAAYGAPLVAHGMNNAYENGYYLLYGENKSGYIRQAYRAVTQKLGYSKDKADIAYSVVDIGLSGYGMVRPVPRADTFRLFRHINTDFIRGWQEMGAVPLSVELFGDINTLSDVYFSGRN